MEVSEPVHRTYTVTSPYLLGLLKRTEVITFKLAPLTADELCEMAYAISRTERQLVELRQAKMDALDRAVLLNDNTVVEILTDQLRTEYIRMRIYAAVAETSLAKGKEQWLHLYNLLTPYRDLLLPQITHDLERTTRVKLGLK